MNIPIIPDRLFKLLLYIGIGLVIYGFISFQNQYQEYEKKRVEFNVEIKKLENQSKYLDSELKDIYDNADILSQNSFIKNPLSITDSSYSFTRVIIGNKIEKSVSDSIAKLLVQYDLKNKEIKIKNDELLIKEYEIDELKQWLKVIEKDSLYMITTGFLLLFAGYIMWDKNEEIDIKLRKRQSLNMPTYSDNCQSCGKRFNSMVKYGNEKDGCKNYHFCDACYQDGNFTNPDLTLKEIKEQRKKELELKKYSKFRIRVILSDIKLLERWK